MGCKFLSKMVEYIDCNGTSIILDIFTVMELISTFCIDI